jgi:Family of unknown function (DUF6174)
MHRIVRLVPVVLLSFFFGCGDSTGPVSLSLNRLRWEKQNLHEYIYTGRKVCFCNDAGQDVLVLVLSDTVFSARVVGTVVELPKGTWLTVDQLFDFAQRSMGEKHSSVRIEYDPRLGYPTLVDVSCPATIADCGVRIETKNLGGLAYIN